MARQLRAGPKADTRAVLAGITSLRKVVFSPPGDAAKTAITAQSVKAHALDTFGSVHKADHWFNRPNALFQGKRPQEVIQSDPSLVEAALVRIDNGIYV